MVEESEEERGLPVDGILGHLTHGAPGPQVGRQQQTLQQLKYNNTRSDTGNLFVPILQPLQLNKRHSLMPASENSAK
jgi:hypothetical protein